MSVCPKFFEKEIVRDRDDMKETLTERERGIWRNRSTGRIKSKKKKI